MRLLLIILCAVAAVVLFGFMGNSHDPALYGPSVLSWLVSQWLNPGSNSSHGWLIPLFSGYLVWRRREQIAQASRLLDVRGLGLIVLCMVFYWAGYRAQQPRLGVLALIGVLWAVPFYLWGPAVGRLLLFPCVYLLFAMPMGFLSSFTFPLRLISCSVAVWLLQGVGIPVVRHGTTILSSDGAFAPLDVADPCSGLNSIIALTALTAAYGYLTIRSTPLRWVMFVSSIPIAMMGNVVRIAVIVMAAQIVGQEVAMRIYHEYSGFIVFLAAVVLMMAVGSFLNSKRVRQWSNRITKT